MIANGVAVACLFWLDILTRMLVDMPVCHVFSWNTIHSQERVLSAVFARDPDSLSALRPSLSCRECGSFIPKARLRAAPTCEDCDAVVCGPLCLAAHER